MDISIYSQYPSMALSYYSNWAPFHHPDFSYSAAAAIDDPELQSLLNDDDSFCNSLLSPPDFTNAGNGFFPILDNLNSFQQESFFHYYSPQLFDPSLAAAIQDYSPPPPLPHFAAVEKKEGSPSFFHPSLAAPPPLPDFAAVEKKEEGGSLSAQSVAARQRRRRITVKTQELGKLVPGGQKMNTAEMLQSAYKYIKFLQAQVSLLEFLGSSPPFEGEEEFQKLLESPLIQEKLYSTEKCLAPHKLVEQLRCDH